MTIQTTCFCVLFLTILPFLSLAQNDAPWTLTRDISYAELTAKTPSDYAQERCRLDVYGVPVANKSDHPVLVWFHGGGLRGGNKQIPERLLDEGIVIVAANYRLYPKVRSPTYVEDAAAAVAWTLRNIGSYGGDTNQVFVSGHSAGGYLTSMVGLDKRWLAKHKLDPDQLAGLIPLSGHTITHFTPRQERGLKDTDVIVDDMAPLAHVRKDAPPLLLITGDREKEMLGRYEENAYMMRMMRVVGHKDTTILELQGYGHGIVEPACPIVIRTIKDSMKKR